MLTNLINTIQSADRVHIIGGPGSGKTVLARALGRKLGAPVYALDAVAFEGPEFRPRPYQHCERRAREIAAEGRWITEGIFVGWTDALLRKADVVVWLDHVSWWRAAPRIVIRTFGHAVVEVKSRQGTEKFFRLRDYMRNTRQLLFALRTSRDYWSGRERSRRYPATRLQTREAVRPYASKLLHLTRHEDAAVLKTVVGEGSPRLAEAVDRYGTHEVGSATAPLTVDIVVNNYNYGRFVAESIHSALRQTYPHVTVIVVDDGSTDESRQTIDSYGDDVVKVYKANGGQASAFNAGFAAGSGDVVIFLDSDDTLDPSIIERIVDSFSTDRRLSKVQYRMDVIDRDGRGTGIIKPSLHLPMRSGDVRREELLFPFDLTWMATSGNAFARWALEKILPIPEAEFPILADWYVVHLTALLGPVRSLPAVGAHHRVHGENAFESGGSSIDPDRLRLGIVEAERVRAHLQLLSGAVGDADVASLSISDLANRLVSIKLDRDAHPIPDDSLRSLFAAGIRAARGRFDVDWSMRILFMLWFGLVCVTPKRLTTHVSDPFLFPERRPRLNRLLGAAHRDR